jgi:plastocyanin
MRVRILLPACLFLAFGPIPVAAGDEYDPATLPMPDWTSAPNAFYIATVHLDGNANIKGDAAHPPEAFPSAGMPDGGGLLLSEPDVDGDWRIRSFAFQPAQIIVHQGEQVTLNFVGVQGPSHQIAIEGQDAIIELKRGEIKSVTLQAGEPGTIHFASLGRQPSMQGQILVLPRP